MTWGDNPEEALSHRSPPGSCDQHCYWLACGSSRDTEAAYGKKKKKEVIVPPRKVTISQDGGDKF